MTIALAAALPAELSGIRKLGRFTKGCPRRDDVLGDMCYLKGDIHGVDVALFVSGVGDARAYETAKNACAAISPRAYISVGLSGALKADLTPGDVIIGESTATLTQKAGEAFMPDGELLRLAMDALQGAGSVRAGALLASPNVAVTSVEKKALALAYRCAALDMETAGAARACDEAGVPFLAIRAISDTLDEDLPVDFNRFMAEGGLDWPRFLLHVLTHPFVIPGLVRLGMQSSLAERNLASAIGRVLGKL